jgi:hypothetical protein
MFTICDRQKYRHPNWDLDPKPQFQSIDNMQPRYRTNNVLNEAKKK